MKKTETKSTMLLKHHLKSLKLPAMHEECEKVAAQCAKDNADHLAFLPHQLRFHKGDKNQKNAQDKQDKHQPHGNPYWGEYCCCTFANTF